MNTLEGEGTRGGGGSTGRAGEEGARLCTREGMGGKGVPLACIVHSRSLGRGRGGGSMVVYYFCVGSI